MNQVVKNNNISNTMDLIERAKDFASFIANSDILPEHYRGKVANVFIAVYTAFRMDIDPMFVLQNSFVVRGKFGISSSFAISLANASGKLSKDIDFRIKGEGASLEVTAYAVTKCGKEISHTVTMKMAHAEGWAKNNSKYSSMPELMLKYRAAMFLIRTHLPGALSGIGITHASEELEDVTSSTTSQVQTVSKSVSESLLDKVNSKINDLAPIDIVTETKEVEIIDNEEQIYTNDLLVTDKTDPALHLSFLIKRNNVPDEVVDKWLAKANADTVLDLNPDEIKKCIQFIHDKYTVSV